MKRSTSMRRLKAHLAVSTILAAGIAGPVFAQTANTPAVKFVDENGIDIRDGTFQLAEEYLTIGDGDGKLNFIIRLNTVANLIADRNNVLADHNYAGYAFAYVGNDNEGLAEVVFDGRTEGFTGSGSSFAEAQSMGSTLTRSGDAYIYTRSDGVIITFGQAYPDQALGEHKALPTLIQFPNGKRVQIHYKEISTIYGTQFRIQSVTNSFGYQLKFSYASADTFSISSVTAINNAVDYCDPTADSCTGLTQSWPSMSIAQSNPSGSLYNNPNIISVTDPKGDVTQYRVGPTTDPYQYYAPLQGIKRPGRATENFTMSAWGVPGPDQMTLVNNGISYNYHRTTTPAAEQALVRTDPLGNTLTGVNWTDNPCPKAIEDGLHRRTSFTCDGGGRLNRVIYPEGNYVEYTYGPLNQVTQTKQVAKPGSGLPNILTSTTYPSACATNFTCNKPATTTDERGQVTNYSYDPVNGELLAMTLPASPSGVRPQKRFTYGTYQAYYKNSSGSILASGMPISLLVSVSECRSTSSCAGTSDEIKTSFGYGPQSAGTPNNLNKATQTSGSGDGLLAATVTYGYDVIGNLITTDGPLPGSDDSARVRYDAARQVVGNIGPDPDGPGPLKHRATRLTRNPEGQVTSTEVGVVASQSDNDWLAFSPIQAAQAVYDANGRKTTEIRSAGGTTHGVSQVSYDAAGRVECVALRMNGSAWSTLPSACTLGPSGSDGPDRITKNTYDAADELTKAQRAFGTADQVDSATNTYSLNGKIATTTDANGNKTTFEYDGFDRPSKTRYPAGAVGSGSSSTTDYEQSTYDAAGNVTGRRLRDGTSISLTYDNLGRMTSKDLPPSELDVAYTYDLQGNLTQAVNAASQSVAFGYDALGRIKTETTPVGTMSSGYNLAGQRTSLAWPDGFYVNYDYLTTGEISAVRENGASSGVAVLAQYTHDQLGRRTGVIRGNGTSSSFGYDGASRLTSLGTDLSSTGYDSTNGFGYNSAGQITQMSRSNSAYSWNAYVSVNRGYSHNSLNQMTTAGGASFLYDGRGNLTFSLGANYTYSSENLLTSGPGVNLAYDPLTRLYQVVGAGTTRFGYDGADVVGEYNSSNVLTKRYVHGVGTDEPLVWYEGADTSNRRWLIPDERGSIVAVTDATGGALAINSYDEYGIPSYANSGLFQYTGQLWLPDLGMYSYKSRIYSPTLGRFMQPDPIGYGDGLNLYAYVHNDPINARDPSGTQDAPIPPEDQITVNGRRRGVTMVSTLPMIDFDGGHESFSEKGEGTPEKRRPKGKCMIVYNDIKRAAAWMGIKYDTDIEQNALADYLMGRKSPMRLNQDALDRATAYFKKNGRSVVDAWRRRPDGKVLALIHFANLNSPEDNEPVLDGLLGQATVLFNENDVAVGITDTFNFDSKSRGPLIEIAMKLVQWNRSMYCGTSGGFTISAGEL